MEGDGLDCDWNSADERTHEMNVLHGAVWNSSVGLFRDAFFLSEASGAEWDLHLLEVDFHLRASMRSEYVAGNMGVGTCGTQS